MEPQRPRRLTGKRVLVIDDSEDNRELTQLILQGEGAVVNLASNGKEGVAQALAQPFDTILMDIQMPGMDGYEATKELRKLGYVNPIIALTSYAMEGEHERCSAAGCDFYISKPFKFDKLVQAVLDYSPKSI